MVEDDDLHIILFLQCRQIFEQSVISLDINICSFFNFLAFILRFNSFQGGDNIFSNPPSILKFKTLKNGIRCM